MRKGNWRPVDHRGFVEGAHFRHAWPLSIQFKQVLYLFSFEDFSNLGILSELSVISVYLPNYTNRFGFTIIICSSAHLSLKHQVFTSSGLYLSTKYISNLGRHHLVGGHPSHPLPGMFQSGHIGALATSIIAPWKHFLSISKRNLYYIFSLCKTKFWEIIPNTDFHGSTSFHF